MTIPACRASGALPIPETDAASLPDLPATPHEALPGSMFLPLPHAAPLREGWYLLQGVLRRTGGDYDARVHYDVGFGLTRAASVQVPTSAKGTMNEVIRLPAGVLRVAFTPGQAASHELGPLRLRRLGPIERRWLMLRRVLATSWNKPHAMRCGVRHGWLGALADLQEAYRRASCLRSHAAAPAYREWIEINDQLTADDCRRIRQQVATWSDAPRLLVVLAGQGQAQQETLASLEQQLYRNFAVAHGEEHATQPAADWVMLVRAGSILPPHALYWFAHEARAHPGAAVIYADEDALDAAGRRCDPQFKPDWSLAHARSTRFVGEAVVLRADLLHAAGGLGPEDLRHGSYDGVLRVLDASPAGDGAVRHIPAVLLHRPGVGPDPAADAWAVAAVRAHLERRGVCARVEPASGGTWRVRYPLPAQPPRVSIIVPTRDALALTRRCIDSLRELTRYASYEILLVDNQSAEPEAITWMREQAAQGKLRLLSYDRPFNYSAINNFAVREARGELVCLLNNDTEVIQPDWLEEMVVQLLQPGVEVVGAKLLYADGSVQHAGDLVGVGGVANHAHAWLDADAPGYCRRAIVPQEYSAVTGACLLTRRQRFLDLGGLDEVHLPVAFNDVDYCLRVREAGGHVVWTPHARLVHHESVSRGKDASPEQQRRARGEVAYMRRRWRVPLKRDPFYNPNLSHERADFSLSHAPVLARPWKD